MDIKPIKLYPFQEEPYPYIVNCIKNYYLSNKKDNTGGMLVMPAGTGKTYISGKVLIDLQIKVLTDLQNNKVIPSIDPNEFRQFTILILTVSKAITQLTRVFQQAGLKDFLVTSHASLLDTVGNSFIYYVNELHNNEIESIPYWEPDNKPDIIIFDESQKHKNHLAQISIITLAAVKAGILVIDMSATPFTRLSESLVSCVIMGLCAPNVGSHRNFIQQFGGDYYEYSPTAMERFNDYLVKENLKWESHNIKFEHKVFNRCHLIDFECLEHRKMYEAAYDDYIDVLIKADRATPEGIAAVWVAMLKWREMAELVRSGQLAKQAYWALTQGKQVAVASNFVASLNLVKQFLIENHGVKEDKISIIMGGRTNVQRDIDNFQYGKTDFCLLTLKSGGAGLSLHHEHDLKECRPRYGIIPPTWSAIELVQLLGRLHRINSLSTTYQDICWFRRTIEEDVAAKVAIRMRSLRKIVSRRETWVDLFTQEAIEKRIGANTLNYNNLNEKLLTDSVEISKEDDESTKEDTISNTIDSLPLEAYE